MKIQLLYILSALVMISCGGNRKAGAETESADPVEETDFFVFDLESSIAEGPEATTLNELIDSISYIPLETREDALLPGDYYKFVKIGEDMFIRGGIPLINSPVYQFDSLGRYVNKVSYYGRGPNEITLMRNWYANANLKQIYIASLGATYMVVISTENGERYTVRFNPSQGSDKIPLNDSTFVSAQLLYSKDIPNTYLYFIDRTGNLVHTIERNDELLSYNASTSEYAQVQHYEEYWLVPDYKGDAIFHDIFNDTLYRIKSHSEITPHLVFKRGKLSPRPEDKHKLENKKKQVYFLSVMESGDHVFLRYHHDGKILCDVWSKRDGRLMIHTTSKKLNGFPYTLPDGTVIELQVVYADKDNIYCVLEALDAIKFMPGVKEDDNPIIMVAKLKK